jgi:hypothetical protein
VKNRDEEGRMLGTIAIGEASKGVELEVLDWANDRDGEGNKCDREKDDDDDSDGLGESGELRGRESIDKSGREIGEETTDGAKSGRGTEEKTPGKDEEGDKEMSGEGPKGDSCSDEI